MARGARSHAARARHERRVGRGETAATAETPASRRRPSPETLEGASRTAREELDGRLRPGEVVTTTGILSLSADLGAQGIAPSASLPGGGAAARRPRRRFALGALLALDGRRSASGVRCALPRAAPAAGPRAAGRARARPALCRRALRREELGKLRGALLAAVGVSATAGRAEPLTGGVDETAAATASACTTSARTRSAATRASRRTSCRRARAGRGRVRNGPLARDVLSGRVYAIGRSSSRRSPRGARPSSDTSASATSSGCSRADGKPARRRVVRPPVAPGRSSTASSS